MSANTSLDGAMNQLIETYRELNTSVRNLENNAIHDIVKRMRKDELLFAVALKERILGSPSRGVGREAVIGHDDVGDTTQMIVSQFGTARATTLTSLRDLDQEQWEIDTGDGKSIRDRVNELAENDARQLREIRNHLSRKSD